MADPRNPGRTGERTVDSSTSLDLALRGSLPCAWCRYELQGLSVRGVCPECGIAVRATVLYLVDPEAEEFQPLVSPRLTSLCVPVCALAGLTAALTTWALRIEDGIVGSTRQLSALQQYAPWIVLGSMLVSGLSVLGIIRPTVSTSRTHQWLAGVAAFAYLPLLFATWQIQFRIDRINPWPAYFGEAVSVERIVWRLVAGASLIVILLGIRPNARELVRRSMALRTGRVDRQTLLTMAAVVAIAAVGDALRLSAGRADPTPELSLLDPRNLLVIFGSVFLTLGLVGATIDSFRIGRVLRRPSPSMTDIFGDPLARSAVATEADTTLLPPEVRQDRSTNSS